LIVFGFNLDSFVFDQFFDEEFTITDLTNLSPGELFTLRKDSGLKPAFGAIGECTKLAIPGFFV
jgi:hypothetical protein